MRACPNNEIFLALMMMMVMIRHPKGGLYMVTVYVCIVVLHWFIVHYIY